MAPPEQESIAATALCAKVPLTAAKETPQLLLHREGVTTTTTTLVAVAISTTTTLPLGDAGASATPNGISLLLLLFFLVFTFYIFNIVLDLANLAPPEIEYPVNGSSRSTGGLACGHAAGNVLNFGDVDQAAEDHILAQGHVDLTIVHQPPRTLTINESSVIKVRAPCHISMGPLLRHVARSYSPMHSA
ncbi:hypothetical protein CPB84DRAFT_1695351 [Gymnopilus junonius]|uniref:Uncharacterized protein n=1 Tax=Gymnopilus junonius TaxID=109634 RepID=A0A9P5TFQ4_GYMJU|nr:hypothetical protein CPB84DRAFT_1695351 [Gymnopilus junonius]